MPSNASPAIVEPIDERIHLEHKLVEQVANDSEACLEYNERLPQPYAQPHVEQAFQAQHTEKRVTVVLLTCAMGVMGDLGTALYGLFRENSNMTSLSFPPAAWACTGCLWLSVFVAVMFRRSVLKHSHSLVQTMTTCVLMCILAEHTMLNVVRAVNPRADAGLQHPDHLEYEKAMVTISYISGAFYSIIFLVSAHVAAPVWTFLLPVTFGLSTCLLGGQWGVFIFVTLAGKSF